MLAKVRVGAYTELGIITDIRHFGDNYHLCEVLLYSPATIRHLSQVMTASLSVEHAKQTTWKSNLEEDTFHQKDPEKSKLG